MGNRSDDTLPPDDSYQAPVMIDLGTLEELTQGIFNVTTPDELQITTGRSPLAGS
jgi:hypothetical protein